MTIEISGALSPYQMRRVRHRVFILYRFSLKNYCQIIFYNLKTFRCRLCYVSGIHPLFSVKKIIHYINFNKRVTRSERHKQIRILYIKQRISFRTKLKTFD